MKNWEPHPAVGRVLKSSQKTLRCFGWCQEYTMNTTLITKKMMDSYGSYGIRPVQENMGDNNHHTIPHCLWNWDDFCWLMWWFIIPGISPIVLQPVSDLSAQIPKQHQSSMPRRKKKHPRLSSKSFEKQICLKPTTTSPQPVLCCLVTPSSENPHGFRGLALGKSTRVHWVDHPMF